MSILRILPVLLLLIVASAAAQDDLCYEKGGMWDDKIQRCAIRANFEFEITYPVELAQYEIVAQTLDAFVMEQKQLFMQIVTTASSDVEDLPSSFAGWVLSMDYALTYFSDDVVSVVYTVYEYTGGAHPNSFFRTFSFDLEANTVIEFRDMFADNADVFAVLAPLVEADLAVQMGDFAESAWIADGTGENPDNYRNFALAEDEILFLFPPYQVAAYAAGGFEVRIPYTALSSILAPRFQ